MCLNICIHRYVYVYLSIYYIKPYNFCHGPTSTPRLSRVSEELNDSNSNDNDHDNHVFNSNTIRNSKHNQQNNIRLGNQINNNSNNNNNDNNSSNDNNRQFILPQRLRDLLNQYATHGYVYINAPPPASKQIIDKLIDFKIDESFFESKHDDSCPICKEEYSLKEHVKRLPCKHIFHSNCVNTWLKMHGNCPLCRYVLSKDKTPNNPGITDNMMIEDNIMRSFNTRISDRITKNRRYVRSINGYYSRTASINSNRSRNGSINSPSNLHQRRVQNMIQSLIVMLKQYTEQEDQKERDINVNNNNNNKNSKVKVRFKDNTNLKRKRSTSKSVKYPKVPNPSRKSTSQRVSLNEVEFEEQITKFKIHRCRTKSTPNITSDNNNRNKNKHNNNSNDIIDDEKDDIKVEVPVSIRNDSQGSTPTPVYRVNSPSGNDYFNEWNDDSEYTPKMIPKNNPTLSSRISAASIKTDLSHFNVKRAEKMKQKRRQSLLKSKINVNNSNSVSPYNSSPLNSIPNNTIDNSNNNNNNNNISEGKSFNNKKSINIKDDNNIIHYNFFKNDHTSLPTSDPELIYNNLSNQTNITNDIYDPNDFDAFDIITPLTPSQKYSINSIQNNNITNNPNNSNNNINIVRSIKYDDELLNLMTINQLNILINRHKNAVFIQNEIIDQLNNELNKRMKSKWKCQCGNDTKSFIYLPCGHLGLCKICDSRIFSNKCVICNKQYTTKKEINFN